MSIKKYEILHEDNIKYPTKDGRLITLYRIKALVDIIHIHHFVRNGDLGGYVESEKNLSHNNACWVAGNAKVYGNARVGGNAYVTDNAEIYGNANVMANSRVSCHAEIYDNAEVFGESFVRDFAKVYENAKIYGKTFLRDNSKIYGKARVGGLILHQNAKVFGTSDLRYDPSLHINIEAQVGNNAYIYDKSCIFFVKYIGAQNDKLVVYRCVDGRLGCDCEDFCGDVEEFLQKYASKLPTKIYQEYKLLIDVAKSRILGYNIPTTNE